LDRRRCWASRRAVRRSWVRSTRLCQLPRTIVGYIVVIALNCVFIFCLLLMIGIMAVVIDEGRRPLRTKKTHVCSVTVTVMSQCHA
jgi:hypothetical protein